MFDLFSPEVIRMTVGAFIGVMLASIYMGLDREPSIFNGFLGALEWVVYLYLEDHGIFLATIISATAIALLAQIGARVYKMPVTVFLIPSFYPLVPGIMVYKMVFAFLNNDFAMAGKQAVDALITAGAIALAIIAVEVLFTLFSETLHKVRMNKRRRAAAERERLRTAR